jgi:hypothetical protein
LDGLNQLLAEPEGKREADEDSIPGLEVIFEYRDAKARFRALSELGEISIREGEIDQTVSRASERYFSSEREKITWLAKEYIFHERLFSWMDSRRERYRLIYELADLTEPALDESALSNLQKAVRNLETEVAESRDVQQIVSRVASYVQVFGYDHFVEDVTQDRGQWGSSSGIGSREMINLVPGRKSGACHRIVMGLARGRTSKRSLKNVMKSLQSHLRRCAGTTKIVIVITDVWDKESFDSSMDDIAWHRHQGTKFMFLLVNGRRLIPMDLSFT